MEKQTEELMRQILRLSDFNKDGKLESMINELLALLGERFKSNRI